ncbi:MAG: RNA polymerase sigma factor [Bacteroidetes bacterium]|nr:RNA polymerase sigma factor [Bacteroidota bacterium]
MQDEDIAIINAVLAGNSKDYKKLVVKYQDMVMSIAMRVLQQREEAEDTAQLCFLKAYEKLSTFRGNALFSTWLYRIAYHLSISRYRQQKSVRAISLVSFSGHEQLIADEFTEPLTEEDQDLKILEKAMQKLTAEERGLLGLFYMQELSIAEISKIGGWSESNVKVKLFRTRKKLAQLMEENSLSNTHKIYCHESK